MYLQFTSSLKIVGCKELPDLKEKKQFYTNSAYTLPQVNIP